MRKTATEWKAYYSDPKFEQQYTYERHDLGATCTEDGTSILLWSPVAETVNVRFFQDGETGKPYRTEVMEKEKQGVWAYRTKEMLHGVYYDFELVIEGEAIWSADPYAKACGINGQRSMIVDLKQTDPDGWQEEVSPEMQPEQVIYFGDDNDDVEPIRLAGTGVAMKNAIPAAMEEADYITGTNNEEGVAHYLRRFVL